MAQREERTRKGARGLVFDVPGECTRYLGLDDREALQALLESCSDYFQLVMGEPPAPSAAQVLLQQLPEGKGSQDKHVIGLYEAGNRLIGVLDAVRDYPASRQWWLGLLLLEPRERHQGRGGRWYRAFEFWVAQRGAREVRLGVVEQNRDGLRFWRSQGFEVLEERPSQRMGRRSNVTVVMGHPLAVPRAGEAKGGRYAPGQG